MEGFSNHDGQNFDCVRCHTTEVHGIAGRIYSTPAAMERKSLVEDDLASKIMCESCHSRIPHKPWVKVNDYTDKVACQSCHIPNQIYMTYSGCIRTASAICLLNTIIESCKVIDWIHLHIT